VHRDPVAATGRSEAALEKISRRTLKDGSPVHSLRTLLQELSTIVRNTGEARTGPRNGSTFQMTTTPIPLSIEPCTYCNPLPRSHIHDRVNCSNSLIYKEIPIGGEKNFRLSARARTCCVFSAGGARGACARWGSS
jgi:hypothetical protein